jgi:hypothetical protein
LKFFELHRRLTRKLSFEVVDHHNAGVKEGDVYLHWNIVQQHALLNASLVFKEGSAVELRAGASDARMEFHVRTQPVRAGYRCDRY